MKNRNEQMVTDAPAEKEVSADPKPKTREKKKRIGIVIPKLLNVREKPEAESNVVRRISGGTECVVELGKSTNEFYKVITAFGDDGYCMKEYLRMTDKEV